MVGVKVSALMDRIYTLLPKGSAFRANIHCVNQVIEYVRTFGDWPFLESIGELTLTAEYSTGTVSVAAGGTAVTGVGTTFTSVMVGRRIRMGGNEDYQIATYVSPTSITITPAAIAAVSGAGFSTYQETYALDTTVQNVVEVRDVTNRRTIPRLSPIEGGRMNNWINTTSQYRLGAFSFSRSAATSSTPQLTFVPPPLSAALIRYLYIKRLETVAGPADTIAVPDTMLECLAQGSYSQILRQNGIEQWTQEFNLFKDQLTKRLAVEQPIEAVRIAMTRRDAISPDFVPILYTTLQAAP
jgi:hypothetical protein